MTPHIHSMTNEWKISKDSNEETDVVSTKKQAAISENDQIEDADTEQSAETNEQQSGNEGEAQASKDPPKPPFNVTPAMKHYLELKAKHPDFLLLYQIGDFFEMFLDGAKFQLFLLSSLLFRNPVDAIRGSELLDIAVR